MLSFSEWSICWHEYTSQGVSPTLTLNSLWQFHLSLGMLWIPGTLCIFTAFFFKVSLHRRHYQNHPSRTLWASQWRALDAQQRVFATSLIAVVTSLSAQPSIASSPLLLSSSELGSLSSLSHHPKAPFTFFEPANTAHRFDLVAVSLPRSSGTFALSIKISAPFGNKQALALASSRHDSSEPRYPLHHLLLSIFDWPLLELGRSPQKASSLPKAQLIDSAQI